MTKVKVTYDLAGPVDDAVMGKIAAANGVYGIEAVRLSPSLDSLVVLFDASRLKLEDVESELHKAGLAVRREQPSSAVS
jgi:hypothetical protein